MGTLVLSLFVATTTELSVALDQLDALAAASERGDNATDGWALAQALYAEHASDYEVAWRYVRAAFLVAEPAPATSPPVTMAKKGYDVSLLAIAMKPKRAEAYYWGACALGIHARVAGVLAAISDGVSGKVEAMLTESIQLDRRRHHGGALVALGRYWQQLPWPMQDLERSAALLEEAVRLAPFPARLAYLADTYLDDDRDEEAATTLRACVEAKIRPGKRRSDQRWRRYCQGRLAELED